jgi:phage baseplate assembly protein W
LSYYFSTENDFPTDVILNAHLRRCMIEGIHRQIRNKVRESSQMLRNYEARLGLQTAIALALSRSKIMALGVAKNTYSSHIEA